MKYDTYGKQLECNNTEKTYFKCYCWKWYTPLKCWICLCTFWLLPQLKRSTWKQHLLNDTWLICVISLFVQINDFICIWLLLISITLFNLIILVLTQSWQPFWIFDMVVLHTFHWASIAFHHYINQFEFGLKVLSFGASHWVTFPKKGSLAVNLPKIAGNFDRNSKNARGGAHWVWNCLKKGGH